MSETLGRNPPVIDAGGSSNASPTDEDDDYAVGNSFPTGHRVSIVSSSSSGSIMQMKHSMKNGVKRGISSISSSDNSIECAVGNKHLKENNAHGDSRLTRFQNARILRRDGSLMHGSITVDQNSRRIVNLSFDADGEGNYEEDLMQVDRTRDGVQVYDCNNQIISPGFIDIQLNGAYGVDFSNADGSTQGLKVDDIFDVARKLLATGVTSFCPTMVSSSQETYQRIIPLIRKARKQQAEERSIDTKRGANILGMHLEGPFFAPSKRGAHDNTHIYAPSKGLASVITTYGLSSSKDEITTSSRFQDIDIITLAPELEGAQDAIKSLTEPKNSNEHAVVVSCGHTEATYEDGMQAVANGATLLTHLYNAMNPFHHRKPGLVGLLSSELKLSREGFERPFFSIIVDGIHVHEAAVAMAYNSHPSGCVLVTDAMAAMGLGDGTHTLGNMSVDIKCDRATLTGSDTLAGSVVSMDICVRRFQQFTGCSIGEALLCATLHPALVLRRHCVKNSNHHIGVLEVGATADMVLLNDSLEVLGTVVGGAVASILNIKN